MSKRKAPKRVWVLIGVETGYATAVLSDEQLAVACGRSANGEFYIQRYDLHEPKPKRARKAGRK